jgi:hypothetical protein
MATTSQLLTWIELQNHGWSREGARGSRALLNEAHKLLLYDEREQRIVVDPTTGNIPFIATVDAVYRYSLPATCSILKAVLIDSDETLEDSPWSYEDFKIKGQSFYRVLNITSREKTLSDDANFTFLGVNPGDTTEKFRVLYYEYPVEITSDSIQHEMPGVSDMDFLIPATIKLIEGIDHGNFIEAREYISKVIRPQFQAILDRGDQGVPLFCRKRAF